MAFKLGKLRGRMSRAYPGAQRNLCLQSAGLSVTAFCLKVAGISPARRPQPLLFLEVHRRLMGIFSFTRPPAFEGKKPKKQFK